MGQVHWFADYLMDCQGLALVDEVAAAQFFGSEANYLSYAIEVAFQGEDALRGAEAPEGAVGGHVGGYGAAADADVGAMVGACGVDGTAGEDYLRERGVGAAIDGEVDVHG